MIKKILFMAMVIACFSAYAVVAQAEVTSLQYAGDKMLTLGIPDDDRVVGYIVYFEKDGDVEYNYKLEGRETNEWVIQEGLLYPGSTYIFTATSYDPSGNESVRSEALEVYIEPLSLPDNFLPEIYQPRQITINITIQ